MATMKAVLFFLVISCLDIIFITFSSCSEDLFRPIKQSKILNPIQILNPRKFLKVRPNENQKQYLKKRVDRKLGYTVFPPIVDQHSRFGVPDSPFFSREIGIEPKLRVKKVLPDIFGFGRRKRSVNNEYAITRNVTEEVIYKEIEMNTENTRTEKITHKKRRRTFSKSDGNMKRKQFNKTSSTTPLKYTEKNRKRGLRKAKRTERGELTEQKNQKTTRNMQRNLHKKKQRRQANKDSRRLIASKDTMISEYPYVVSIQKHNEHWCAGALLNPRLVITTANCVWNTNRVTRLKVRAGSTYWNRGGDVIEIQEVMKHPNFSIRGKPNHDVALLLLDKNIRFSHKVHGLDLPNEAMKPPFEDVWVASWGSDRRDGIFEEKEVPLQVYHSRLMDSAKCNNVTKRFGVTVNENFICLEQTGRRAPCTRDTGAPAVSDGVLWGLASWGLRKSCGTERYPAMFSYMGSQSNLDFIKKASISLMAEQRHYPFPDRFSNRPL